MPGPSLRYIEPVPFSPRALSALVEASTHLAGLEGTLAYRFTESVTYLEAIRPDDLDAELWIELIKVRGNITRGGSRAQLQWAAETLVKILVRYAACQPK